MLSGWLDWVGLVFFEIGGCLVVVVLVLGLFVSGSYDDGFLGVEGGWGGEWFLIWGEWGGWW